MRHIWIRGILSLLWLGAAIVSGASGRLETAALYCLMGGMFFYSAYAAWKKEQDNEGGM